MKDVLVWPADPNIQSGFFERCESIEPNISASRDRPETAGSLTRSDIPDSDVPTVDVARLASEIRLDHERVDRMRRDDEFDRRTRGDGTCRLEGAAVEAVERER